jgi:hypothetical protein
LRIEGGTPVTRPRQGRPLAVPAEPAHGPPPGLTALTRSFPAVPDIAAPATSPRQRGPVGAPLGTSGRFDAPRTSAPHAWSVQTRTGEEGLGVFGVASRQGATVPVRAACARALILPAYRIQAPQTGPPGRRRGCRRRHRVRPTPGVNHRDSRARDGPGAELNMLHGRHCRKQSPLPGRNAVPPVWLLIPSPIRRAVTADTHSLPRLPLRP